MLRRIIAIILISGVILSAAFFVWISFPSDFTSRDVFLSQGTVPKEIATSLEEMHVVRSAFVLRVVLKLRGTAGALVPGEYAFTKKQSVFKVASRITRGDFGMEQVWITIPEGSTNEQISEIILTKFPDFNTKKFLDEVDQKQGYLFPETYRFLSTSTEAIIEELTDSFDYHVRDLQSEAITDGHDWDDVVIMASILEEEANTPEDFKIVSGILWKRLKIGMALQVDVSPITYERPGFPPQPLSNPGLQTLEAALRPGTTPYLYYLTGKDGIMHYAETYEKHQANIKKYLK